MGNQHLDTDTVKNKQNKSEFDSQRLFENGYFCTEGVLMSVAKQHGIESPLIPAIATGFCSGMARTSGMCGALTGGMLAVNVALGRQFERQSVERNDKVDQELVSEFKNRCDSVRLWSIMQANRRVLWRIHVK